MQRPTTQSQFDAFSSSEKQSIPTTHQIKPNSAVQIIDGKESLDTTCLLDGDDHHVWLSKKQKKTQPFILQFKFDCAKSSGTNEQLRQIILKCWHAYLSNPAIVQLEVSSTTDSNFVHWQTYRLELRAGFHYCTLKRPIRVRELKYIRLIITETHDSTNCRISTYLNQVIFATKEFQDENTS